MSEHTPGPWQVLEVMEKKFVAAKPPADSPYAGHTRFQDIGGDEDYPRKDADLALIAAAPDLLAFALKITRLLAIKAATADEKKTREYAIQDAWEEGNAAIQRAENRATIQSAGGGK